MISSIQRQFVWIIIAFSVTAYLNPSIFLWVKPHISQLLALIMLGIGINLSSKEIQTTWKLRNKLLLVVLIRFLLLSTSSYLIARLFHLPLYDLIGLVIIGACPGGTASNVMALLSKSNASLTIMLTLVTTLLSPIFLPILAFLFLHKHVEIPIIGIFATTLTIVILPVLLGAFVKKILPKSSTTLLCDYFPLLSILSIALIVAYVIAENQVRISGLPILVFLSVLIVNLLGYIYGYSISRLLKLNLPEKQALTYEFGMQDTGLGVVIATTFFSPAAALSGAIFSMLQNITAPILIKIWNARKTH